MITDVTRIFYRVDIEDILSLAKIHPSAEVSILSTVPLPIILVNKSPEYHMHLVCTCMFFIGGWPKQYCHNRTDAKFKLRFIVKIKVRPSCQPATVLLRPSNQNQHKQ